MASLVCVYDANVLYPAQLRDLLMRLALAELVRAHWTDRIHREWVENLLEDRPDISPEQLERTRELMEQALPGAHVDGEAYRRHIGDLDLPDPKDRHVLAAAIETEAEVIVTFNLRDFPAEALEPYSIRAVHPDVLVLELIEEDPAGVLEAMRRHRRTQRRPPISPEQCADVLRNARLDKAAGFAAQHRSEL